MHIKMKDMIILKFIGSFIIMLKECWSLKSIYQKFVRRI